MAVPGYQAARVSSEVRNGSYVFLKKYDILFRVEAKVPHGKKFSVRGRTLDEVEFTQKAVAVRDLQRLIVQHMNNIYLRDIDVPEVFICHRHNNVSAEDARKTGACLALPSGLKDSYMLLWGAGDASDDEEGSADDDDVGYETGDGL